MTFTEAIVSYVESRTAVLSPTTIQDYRCIQKYAFTGLMGLKLKEIDEELLQEHVNLESTRQSQSKGYH